MDDLELELLKKIEELESEMLSVEEIWEQLQELPCTDETLDRVVGHLEESGNHKLAHEISLGIHTPTLANDLERRKPSVVNDRCNNADWQIPRTKEVNHDQL